MKPATFLYHDPTTIEETVRLLDEYGDEARILAGGQSLVPMMNLRLSNPGRIVDINRVRELDYVRSDQGALTIGALTRQRAVERSKDIRELCPLLADAMPHLGHFQIRNRGTIGGSVAHADPAADIPAVIVALDGVLLVRDAMGSKTISAEDFFISFFTTALGPTELLEAIHLPPWPSGTGWAFLKMTRREGDFAIVGVATRITLDSDGICGDSRIAFFGVSDAPVRARTAEAMALGTKMTSATIAPVAKKAVSDLRPESDIHASADYRLHAAELLAQRAMKLAIARAAGGR